MNYGYNEIEMGKKEFYIIIFKIFLCKRKLMRLKV